MSDGSFDDAARQSPSAQASRGLPALLPTSILDSSFEGALAGHAGRDLHAEKKHQRRQGPGAHIAGAELPEEYEPVPAPFPSRAAKGEEEEMRNTIVGAGAEAGAGEEVAAASRTGEDKRN
jgi:hypothetical protein